ncbi:MAG: ferredoxin-thioredoxin reductase catalytic domain-containing protein [Bacillota bacterium]|nr:ferredoxin-thioredoxin reductase catalytic domain-containing protein [Bacillota bacterium]
MQKMAIRLNKDVDMVARIKEGLLKRGGYCPCRLERSDDNKCICKEFREQIADPNYEGYCHCMLYYKEK